MEDTMQDQRSQEAPSGGENSRALATQRANRRDTPRVADLNFDYLDDTPVYASTGVRTFKFGRGGKYWIEYLEELDFGQQTVLDNASVVGVLREQSQDQAQAGQTVRLDLTRQRFLLCASYITRWKIPPDRNGREIRWPRHMNDRIETMKHINPKWGDAIVQVITAHVAEQQEEEQAAQADMDAAADLREEENERNDSPPQPSQNGAHVVDVQPSQSVSSPVGVSAN
jgi:hypothetical protein